MNGGSVVSAVINYQGWKFWLIFLGFVLLTIWIISRGQFSETDKDTSFFTGFDPMMPGSMNLNEETIQAIKAMRAIKGSGEMDEPAPRKKEKSNKKGRKTNQSDDDSVDESEYVEYNSSDDETLENKRTKNRRSKGKSPVRRNRFDRDINEREKNIHNNNYVNQNDDKDKSVDVSTPEESSTTGKLVKREQPKPLELKSEKTIPMSDKTVKTGNSHPKLKENRCRQILENIYGKPFPTCHPKWLKNPNSKGGVLELDCYNEELGIALEYDGEQHYHFPNPWHKTKEDFIKNKQRDLFKDEVCEMNGVYLIRVPYTVSYSKLEEYIRGQLPDESTVLT